MRLTGVNHREVRLCQRPLLSFYNCEIYFEYKQILVYFPHIFSNLNLKSLIEMGRQLNGYQIIQNRYRF